VGLGQRHDFVGQGKDGPDTNRLPAGLALNLRTKRGERKGSTAAALTWKGRDTLLLEQQAMLVG
jgi:hypothetical protein